MCPRCGSQVPLRRSFNPASKPFCARCGWNLDRAEARLGGKSIVVKLLPIGVAAVGLLFFFTSTRANSPFIFIVPALFALIALLPLWSYNSVQKAIAAAKLTVNPALAQSQPPLDPSLQMLQSLPRPRQVRFRFQGSLGAVAIVVVAVLGLTAFFLAGAQAHRRNFHGNKDSFTILLPLVFMLFVFVFLIAVPLFREKRNLPLLRDGELALARVVAQQTVQQGKTSYSKIDYEFKTNTGQSTRNSCRDLTNAVFEDMTIPVFYDALDPSKNIAACATYLKIVDSFQ